MHWFDRNLGRFNLADKWVGIDYGSLFLDPIKVEGVVAHEWSHSVMAATTDMGLATTTILELEKFYTKINKASFQEIVSFIMGSQIYVQEGFATLMQLLRLREIAGKAYAVAEIDGLPAKYSEWLSPMRYWFEHTGSYRDEFIGKCNKIALESNFRIDSVNLDLLSNPMKLKMYFEDVQHNPNERLKMMCGALKYRKWLVTKDEETLARECGVQYYTPATKKQVAEYLTYVSSLTNEPHIYGEEMVGDAPEGREAFLQASRSMIVGNMNLRLAESAEVLLKEKDFFHYADQIEIIFINPFNEFDHISDLFNVLTGNKPEIALVAITSDGTKYITLTSDERARFMLDGCLKAATLCVKWGGYDFDKKGFRWLANTRPPDVLIYNRISDLSVALDNIFARPGQHKYIEMGASEGHPLRTFLIKQDDGPLHAVNTYLGTFDQSGWEKIKINAAVMSPDDIRSIKDELNNYMVLWNNLPRAVDWVASMLDGKEVIYRR